MLQKNEHKNIIFKTDLFFLKIGNRKQQGVKEYILLPSHIIKKIKYFQHMRQLPPTFLLNVKNIKKGEKYLQECFYSFSTAETNDIGKRGNKRIPSWKIKP